MKKMSTGEGFFLLAYLFAVLLPAASLWNAFVLTKLWAWFVVGAFGMPPLALATAAGLSVVVSLFKGTPKADKESVGETLGWNIFAVTFKAVMHPLFALAFGYIIKVLS